MVLLRKYSGIDLDIIESREYTRMNCSKRKKELRCLFI
uniref:Bm13044 n=1 Tax=Brugia malayi TaxID=6279 RepID=A0A1I9G0R3_BRUMA|nr:Bm13044 [Brugia malayi]